MELLDDVCVDAYYSLERDTNPRAKIPTDRNEMCIGILETIMPVGLGRVYAQFVLPEGSRVSALLPLAFIRNCDKYPLQYILPS